MIDTVAAAEATGTVGDVGEGIGTEVIMVWRWGDLSIEGERSVARLLADADPG